MNKIVIAALGLALIGTSASARDMLCRSFGSNVKCVDLRGGMTCKTLTLGPHDKCYPGAVDVPGDVSVLTGGAAKELLGTLSKEAVAATGAKAPKLGAIKGESKD